MKIELVSCSGNYDLNDGKCTWKNSCPESQIMEQCTLCEDGYYLYLNAHICISYDGIKDETNPTPNTFSTQSTNQTPTTSSNQTTNTSTTPTTPSTPTPTTNSTNGNEESKAENINIKLRLILLFLALML